MNIKNIVLTKTKIATDAYRNIYTCIDSQDLFDDIPHIYHSKRNDILRSFENFSSGIDHAKVQKNRVFEYGNAQ